MPPFHIKDEFDYALWVEKTIESAGAFVEGQLLYEAIEIAEEVFAGVVIRKHRAKFADGSILTFSIFVNSELEAENYSFDFRLGEALVWRKDRHPGHESETGGEEHVHRGPGGEDYPDDFPGVEIDEVVGEILDFQRDGSLP